MQIDGDYLQVRDMGDGFIKLEFDQSNLQFSSPNLSFVEELKQKLQQVKLMAGLKGLEIALNAKYISSQEDRRSLLALLALPEQALAQWRNQVASVVGELESLSVPTVAIMRGITESLALELAFACDFRLIDEDAVVGFPQVNSGLMFCFGGTIRLSRIVNVKTAFNWMSSGREITAQHAYDAGAVDTVCKNKDLQRIAQNILKDAANNNLNWQGRRLAKKNKTFSSIEEVKTLFESEKLNLGRINPKHYPAKSTILETLIKSCVLQYEDALIVEETGFLKLAKSETTKELINARIIIEESRLRYSAVAKRALADIETVGVIGAGIMGGGISFQCASKGLFVIMKDIRDDALELGISEASKLLNFYLKKRVLTESQVKETLNRITPTLEDSTLMQSNIVVEAVVENQKVKESVLTQLESQLNETAILCSNTSTISINALAEKLSKPENFCGMHFFNPVHKMPLVEVIRGEHTSSDTISSVVALTLKIGKVPVVVNDCPGFLVNRILFPYLAAFSLLVLEGVDYSYIDEVMEQEFGWPMGPAYLLDVVGIDTAEHASRVMAEGFPDRLSKIPNDPITLLYENQQFGQKNGSGFYRYRQNESGRTEKSIASSACELISRVSAPAKIMSKQEIINRLMLPMGIEAIRCVEDKITDSAEEVDLALLYGLGFPQFRGGIFRYWEHCGLQKLLELSREYSAVSQLYQLPANAKKFIESGKRYLR